MPQYNLPIDKVCLDGSCCSKTVADVLLVRLKRVSQVAHFGKDMIPIRHEHLLFAYQVYVIVPLKYVELHKNIIIIDFSRKVKLIFISNFNINFYTCAVEYSLLQYCLCIMQSGLALF